MTKKYTPYGFVVIIFWFISTLNAQVQLTNSPFEPLVNNYLEEHLSSHNLTNPDIQDLLIQNEVYSKSTKITHLYLNQQFQGIKIYNAISSLAIKDEKVFYFANRFLGGVAEKVNTTSPQITAQNAIEKLAVHLGLPAVQNVNLKTYVNNKFLFSSGNISRVDIPVELMLFHNNAGRLVLVWDLSIYDLSARNWWTVRLDAVNGEILDVQDFIVTCNFGDANHETHQHVEIPQEFSMSNAASMLTANDNSQYNVFPFPVESPIHGSRQLVIEPASELASPFGWHDTDGVAGPEFTITRGNNVWAQEDRSGTNQVGFSPDGTAALNFDFELNLNQPPAFYEDAAITNLFYANNLMHDIFYHYGFDEQSGNFQENNYGKGGLGGDFVFADAQDGSGLNNATFGTPPDGQNPGMTMFLWTGSGPAGNPFIINSGNLAGEYTGVSATFGDPLSPTPLTENLALAIDDNSGASTDFFDACDAIFNGSSLNGKIVVIRRGGCEFGAKVLAAENEGALAVIMVNNVPDAPIAMGPGAVGQQVTIPSIMVNQTIGEQIITALINGETINASLVAAPPYQKDGDFDNAIIAHEYGHGISTRLTAGPATVNCLFNSEQMGEGWSDWLGLMVTMKSSDIPEMGRGIGTYVIGQNTNGSGIRPARYSTDFAVNPFTYNDTNNPGLSVPHGVGFVWATTLWDLTWAYIDKYGFDPDLYNGNGGNNKVMQVVLDGLKLQPCQPGFIDGRDAILAAELALTGGEDQCLIWEVFAQRGMGFNADQGLSTERNDQLQDFTLPPSFLETLESCNSLSTDDFIRNSFKIYPNPTENFINISSSSYYGEAALSIYDINGRLIQNLNINLDLDVQIDVTRLNSGWYFISIVGEGFNITEKIIKR
ncbi:T9SS-dependent M36 family metallopeptidase [Paucihalobacter sp.]|uniref:T9SS-dependent M36 family metallopeptidase n=1 Tax=Paucihalobacter sp. TaxID=2850405 RepID=UPI003D161B01